MNKTEQQDKGFTLIELLIVIVILGVLAAVIVFRVANVTDEAETNACQLEVRAVNTAIQAFKADSPTSSWPADLDALVTAGFLEEAPGANTASNGTYDTTTHTYSDTCTGA